MSIRYIIRGLVWVLLGIASAGFGFYIGSRQERSAAIIHAAREVMSLQTLTEQHREADLTEHLSHALEYYSRELDAYTSGYGLNPEHRDAVRAARAEIDRYRASHPDTHVLTSP